MGSWRNVEYFLLLSVVTTGSGIASGGINIIKPISAGVNMSSVATLTPIPTVVLTTTVTALPVSLLIHTINV